MNGTTNQLDFPKILIITLSLSEKNGTGRYSRSLLKELSRYYRLKVFSGQEDINWPAIPNVEIFPVLPGPPDSLKMRNPLFLLKAWHVIRQEIKKEQFDFVHSLMDYPFSLLGYLVAKGLKKPLYLTAHGTYSIIPFNMIPDRWLNSLVLRQAKRIACISSFTESEIKKRMRRLANTVVINNGIDFAKFQKENPLSKNERPTLISVGELKHRKGYHVLIAALAKVKERYPDFIYYIIGDRSNIKYVNQLESLVEKLSLQENVQFLEKVSDEELIDHYYRSHVFALTPVNVEGYFEGFGLVYLEAGACGLPVIGTLGCGAEDAILEGQTGFLVKQNDVGETAAAILKLLDDSFLAEKLGVAGRARAGEMDWENVVKKYINICYA